ncbi:flagellar biosynthesis protein FlhF [Myxococcota bacterium]|nr:flagellar biosynthesis protein FlhF [Myxococcota bacterium]
MHIKRFEAASMEEAIEQVRRALGPDALILSTRTITRGRGAFGLLARSGVEVQAARPRGAAEARGIREDAGLTRAASDRPASTSGGVDDAVGLRRMVESLGREVAALRGRERFEEEMRGELQGIRVALGRALAASRSSGLDGPAERLVHAGLEAGHARALVEEFDAAQTEGRSQTLEAILEARLDRRLAPPRSDGAGRVRILVGAPGAGKTTTLAKLAARNEEGERDVSLVSLDPFRIGAREQLQAYAGLLEVPFEAHTTAEGVADVARRHRDRGILVDTAGRSPGDVARQLPLDALRAGLGEAASIELVVDATARGDVARAQLARFAALRPDRLILTRLDECESLAPIVNLLLEERCPPVCWMGTGQRVPEDLEIAEPGRFVRGVLGRAA